MDKFPIGSTVNVTFTPESRKKLGLDESNHPNGKRTVDGHYPLGHYLKSADGKVIAVADKYDIITKGG